MNVNQSVFTFGVDKMSKINLVIPIETEIHDSLKEKAKQSEQSMAGYVRLAIKNRMEVIQNE